MGRHRNTTIHLLIIAAAVLGATQASAGNFCSYEITDPEALQSANGLLILPFTFPGMSPFPEEVNRKWSIEMPRVLSNKFRKTGIRDVRIPEQNLGSTADGSGEAQPVAYSVDEASADRPRAGLLVLNGEFHDLERGSVAGRIFVGPNGKGSNEASMRVKMVLTRGDDGETIARFDCSRSSAGGPIGMGGYLAGSAKHIMHNHMERFAQHAAKIVAYGGRKPKKENLISLARR